MEQTQTGMNSAIRREVFDSVWQDVAEASLLDDLKAALHGKLSPADQQMMLREFDIPNAPLRQKILLEHILETIHKIAQWSNADALRSTYLGYGHKILFLQSFESSASYALLTLREYLEDYASPATRELGLACIEQELGRIPGDKVRTRAREYLERIAHGERDFRF